MNRRLILTALAAIAAAPVGCGPSAPAANPPGPDRPLAAGPRVVSVSPADGATHVPVRSPLVITFSEELDEATVTAANVVLSPVLEPPAITYDAVRRTITLSPVPGTGNDGQPHVGLGHNTTYTVTLSGLRGAAANPVPPATFTFTTFRNLPTRSVWYSGGAVSSYRTSTYDATGRRTSAIEYSGPGPDGVWFHGGDDAIGSSQVDEYNGVQRRTVDYLGAPGTVVGGYVVEGSDASGIPLRTVRYDGSGGDGAWFATGLDWFATDDRVRSYALNSYDTRWLRIVRTQEFGSPGADGAWFTGDDAVTSITYGELDPSGNLVRSIMRDGTGQVLVTGLNTFDTSRRLVSARTLLPDGTQLVATFQYDAAGNWTGWVLRSAAGVESQERHEYDADGNRTGTADYDSAGRLVSTVSYDTSQ